MVSAPNDELRLRVGCTFELRTTAPTNAVLQVAPVNDETQVLHGERFDDLPRRHRYHDGWGNNCERTELPAGTTRFTYEAELTLVGPPTSAVPPAEDLPLGDLPDEMLVWMMPSRFCQPDELGEFAWTTFGDLTSNRDRVQAVRDHVHDHLEYLIGSSNPWTTSVDAHIAGQGVCRDFTHLAISFCRALNIPARYVSGFVPALEGIQTGAPDDFAAWFEVYLGDGWYTYDAHLDAADAYRVVVARGRDAVDVAMLTTFGAAELLDFGVEASPIP
ncbi:MAG: transglutaminase family protein [Acidimicrobiia bacterium]|nr:transglutaminase family protein [Acidimicrobiia bacterium]